MSLVVVGLILAPLGYIVYATASVDPAALRDLVWRAYVGDLLGKTLELLAATVLLSTLLGVGAAMLIARTDLGARHFWHGILAAPLAVPAFVNSYGWVSLTDAVQSLGGAVLVITFSYYPLVYLPVVAALSTLDAAPEEVARSLGQTRTQAFFRTAFPRLLPAILGGALLVGLHVLSEFGALQLLQYPTFTTAIYGQYRSAFASNAGTVLAGILILLSVVLLSGEHVLRRGRRADRVGRSSGRPVEPVHLGRWKGVAILILIAHASLTLGLPAFSLTHWLIVGSSTTFPLGELTSTLLNTLGLAALGAGVTVFLALPLAWLVVRQRGPISTILERAAYTASSLPGIVVALALITVTIRALPSMYQTLPMLLLAYTIAFIPRAIVSVRASLEQAPPALEEVSRSLGQTSFATFRRVLLPAVAPGIGAGAALVFLAISTELTATLLLAPIGTETLTTQFWSATSDVRYGAAAPYALLLILAAIPATVILTRDARLGKDPTWVP